MGHFIATNFVRSIVLQNAFCWFVNAGSERFASRPAHLVHPYSVLRRRVLYAAPEASYTSATGPTDGGKPAASDDVIAPRAVRSESGQLRRPLRYTASSARSVVLTRGPPKARFFPSASCLLLSDATKARTQPGTRLREAREKPKETMRA